jgi:hypothetical protein
MRVATYPIPAASGQEPGECGVFFFGTGQGGSVEDNLARWASQFESASAPKKTVRTVNGLKVHEIDLTGTYLAPGGPMMQSQGKKPGWRLLGAIVEAPEGLVFFKCVGPSATIQKAEKELEGSQSLTKRQGRTSAGPSGWYFQLFPHAPRCAPRRREAHALEHLGGAAGAARRFSRLAKNRRLPGGGRRRRSRRRRTA